MIERRAFQVDELRIDGNDRTPVITGHAAVFNQRSLNLGGFYEVIAPGAFANTIKTADVRALFNHDANFILGRTKSRTLTLSEDEKGLSVRIAPPDSIWANDLLESIKRGDIDQMSFGFTVSEAGQKWQRSGGEIIRTLLEVELFDVSPVTYPAYPQTDVHAREAGSVAEIRSFFEAKIANLAPEIPQNPEKNDENNEKRGENPEKPPEITLSETEKFLARVHRHNQIWNRLKGEKINGA